MYDRRLTATVDDCSITMRMALAQIRHLTISSFWSGQLPQLPSGLLPRLRELELIAPTYGNKPFDHSTLGPYPARHLIISANVRTPSSAIISQYVTHISPVLDKFTLLIPPRIPFDFHGDVDHHGKAGDVIELVFLSGTSSNPRNGYQEVDEVQLAKQILSWARATHATMYVIGLQDTLGLARFSLFEGSCYRRAEDMCMQAGTDDIMARLKFATYMAWHDRDQRTHL